MKKLYVIDELEIHALAHCSEHAAEALYENLVETKELPPNARVLTREQANRVVLRHMQGDELDVEGFLDELFGEKSE